MTHALLSRQGSRCQRSPPVSARRARRAAIVRYNPDGSGEYVFATGLRNPVGLAFHPLTAALGTTVNERDWRSGDAPADFITEVREGAAYGWPDCCAAGGRFPTI